MFSHIMRKVDMSSDIKQNILSFTWYFLPPKEMLSTGYDINTSTY